MSKRDSSVKPARRRHREAAERFSEWRRLVLNDARGLSPNTGALPSISELAVYRDLTGTFMVLLDQPGAGPTLHSDGDLAGYIDRNAAWREWMLTDRPALAACARLTVDAYVALLEAGHFPFPPAVEPELAAAVPTTRGGSL